MEDLTRTYFPKYFTNRAIGLYFILLIVCSLFFKPMPFQFWIFGIVQVVGFFYFSNKLTKTWAGYSEKLFVKRLFKTALFIRICWVIVSYFYFIVATGIPFEYEAADSLWYNDVSNRIVQGRFTFYQFFEEMGVSDSGYVVYLTIIKKILFGADVIIVVRLIKALLGAWMCVFIYRLAVRNFNESIGRIAAIFCMLMPYLIYYCGLHLKELEMTFLCVAFLERTDWLFRSPKKQFKHFLLPLILALLLFSFRTVLGATAIFALFTSALFSTNYTLKKGAYRWRIIIWCLIAVVFLLGSSIMEEMDKYWEEKDQNQAAKMEFLEKRTENQFIKYVSGSIFAPLMFVMPMPSITYEEQKENQMSFHGNVFIKGIMAFFCMYAIVLLIIQKKWRNNLLLITFLLAYSLIIVFSGFLFAARFYLPIVPCFMILSAYGVCTFKKKNMYVIYLYMYAFLVFTWSYMRTR